MRRIVSRRRLHLQCQAGLFVALYGVDVLHLEIVYEAAVVVVPSHAPGHSQLALILRQELCYVVCHVEAGPVRSVTLSWRSLASCSSPYVHVHLLLPLGVVSAPDAVRQ